MAKRKRSAVTGVEAALSPRTLPANIASVVSGMIPVKTGHGSIERPHPEPANINVDPDTNPDLRDGQAALRASPDADEPGEKFAVEKAVPKKKVTKAATPNPKLKISESESSLSELSDIEDPVLSRKAPAKNKAAPKKNGVVKKEEKMEIDDPEVEDNEEADPEEFQAAISRPPPVNSSYLPLPWKGRLGYACLNTYLRSATPPVFASRTCRIASILEHRHPLKDPSQPEHATKNRPDKDQPADIARGQAYVEAIGVANAKDIPKMLRWNDRYGIKFLRLSSEMFPFASHDVYGYKLAPFASEALAEAGRVATELGHRLTTHPGQFTQLGSPRPEVITAALRDLDYHCELLDLLKLPPQQDRDAVMVLHMGGIFGDKEATLQRFRDNYAKLPQKVKDRLVLENDDVCYSVHDLLPICEELNIPMVLDFHHHNIVFDADKIREGTHDIMGLYDRIKATWDRKQIKQKMHYSEPTPAAVTGRERRKHNPRPATLPPCAPDMDLMIEAKDKEQAVFELMRTFKLPGFETFNDILPYVRRDENKPWKPPKKKTPRKKKNAELKEEEEEEPEPQPPPIVPDDEIAMGGPEGRVYWPPGMEEWLRPKKREVKPRDPEKAKTTSEKAAQRRAEKAAWQAAREASADGESVGAGTVSASASEVGDVPAVDLEKTRSVYDKSKTSKSKPARAGPAKSKKSVKSVPTPSASDHDEDEDVEMPDLTDAEEDVKPTKKARSARPAPTRQGTGRAVKAKAVSYVEGDEED